MRAFNFVTSSVLLIAVALGGSACTPFETTNAPPVAIAGEDQMLEGERVNVQLDGRESYDDDGEIVRWEWYYTGTVPLDDDELPPAPVGDAGMGSDDDDVPDFLKPRPEFCGEEEDEEITLPARYCVIDQGTGSDSRTSIELEPGRYRFTLWVVDDKDQASNDTVEVIITP